MLCCDKILKSVRDLCLRRPFLSSDVSLCMCVNVCEKIFCFESCMLNLLKLYILIQKNLIEKEKVVDFIHQTKVCLLSTANGLYTVNVQIFQKTLKSWFRNQF